MKENYTVCNCMDVSYSDIADALETHKDFDSVRAAFDEVQSVTQCATGCGGCYQRILDVISEIMMAK